MAGVGFVVHAAAETAGGQDEHQRNSIDATRHVFEAAADAGVKQGVHVSSLAVIKPGHEVGGILDEQTPLDAGHIRRGPYVWGKAESELIDAKLCGRAGDRDQRSSARGRSSTTPRFHPPGRLGRELGPYFVAIGGKKTPLSVCDVGTAGRVIRSYVEDFAAAPPMVNLVEAPPPTRRDLLARFTAHRPDLKFYWFPGWLLRALGGPLKLVQRCPRSKQPVDVYAAFASERYRLDLALRTIERAGPSAVTRTSDAAREVRS